jgi:hypothetical protein
MRLNRRETEAEQESIGPECGELEAIFRITYGGSMALEGRGVTIRELHDSRHACRQSRDAQTLHRDDPVRETPVQSARNRFLCGSGNQQILT